SSRTRWSPLQRTPAGCPVMGFPVADGSDRPSGNASSFVWESSRNFLSWMFAGRAKHPVLSGCRHRIQVMSTVPVCPAVWQGGDAELLAELDALETQLHSTWAQMLSVVAEIDSRGIAGRLGYGTTVEL